MDGQAFSLARIIPLALKDFNSFILSKTKKAAVQDLFPIQVYNMWHIICRILLWTLKCCFQILWFSFPTFHSRRQLQSLKLRGKWRPRTSPIMMVQVIRLFLFRHELIVQRSIFKPQQHSQQPNQCSLRLSILKFHNQVYSPVVLEIILFPSVLIYGGFKHF